MGFSRIIAYTIQDFLDNYVNVSVGNANKIDPEFLVEEKLDYLIIGDTVKSKKIPSPELQTWLINLSELCKKNKLVINSISSYYITSTDIDFNWVWIKFFQEYNFSLAIFPPILHLKLEEGGLNFEKNILTSVKNYSNEFIEFFIKNKNGAE